MKKNRSSKAIIGIYKITNPNNEVYVGQSINIKNRKDSYRRLACKKQPKIYNSLIKYGWNAHKKDILEICSIKQLDEKEIYWKQYYLDQVGEDWNKVLFCDLYDTGGGPKSEQHKQNISSSLKNKPKSEQHKQNMKLAHLGKKRPKYIGEKISESKTGTKQIRTKRRKDVGISKSSEHRKKMSLSKIGKPSTNPKKAVLQYDKQDNLIKEWSSISEAGKILNIHFTNISSCCLGNYKTAGGFVWKYK
jgi:group I intron endonuclease